MRKLLILLLISLVLLPLPLNAAPAGLSQDSIKRMLTAMEKAVGRRDADGLLAFFTPDAVITLDMPSSMGGRMILKLAEYKQMLLQGWALSGNSSYEVREVVIKISPDAQRATVTDLTIEKAEINGETISGQSREKIEIIVVGGKPRIKSLYGKTVFD